MSAGLTEQKNIKISIYSPKKNSKNGNFMESTIRKTTSVEFPQKDELYEKSNRINEYSEIGGGANAGDSYSLSVEEFNPHNVAGSPPNMFISMLEKRMGTYGFQ